MDYNTPLLEGQFLKRYKRFFADVKLGDEIVTAHVPNTGSLKGICDQPRNCRVQPSDNPARKLKFTLEQVELPTSWVGVNTHRANELAWEAFTHKKIPHWREFNEGAREVKINSESRLDMKLTSGESSLFIEVKSVTMAEGLVAQFPDAVTTRGQKHLIELMKIKNDGALAELLFVVQRNDCHEFSPAKQIDPEYAKLLLEAQRCGVKISAYATTLTSDRAEIDSSHELKLLLT
ncbi:MAG: DNA/RNA nuclease SfsA [Bdellovibrionales bacterium]|nr:DNA/RNA nuclease SfsA [Bdellovibrionales bacterium]